MLSAAEEEHEKKNNSSPHVVLLSDSCLSHVLLMGFEMPVLLDLDPTSLLPAAQCLHSPSAQHPHIRSPKQWLTQKVCYREYFTVVSLKFYTSCKFQKKSLSGRTARSTKPSRTLPSVSSQHVLFYSS